MNMPRNMDDVLDRVLEVFVTAFAKASHRYTVGKQPCQNLRRGEGSMPGVSNVHQCPVCEGNRTWCENCYADHHDGGWETCKPGAYAEPAIDGD